MALSGNSRAKDSSFPDVIELNVGGQVYYTRHATLISNPGSLLGKIFSPKNNASNDLARDPKGRYFIDRDGFLFRYVLDYLRDRHVVLPDHFPEKGRLRKEAEYFQCPVHRDNNNTQIIKLRFLIHLQKTAKNTSLPSSTDPSNTCGPSRWSSPPCDCCCKGHKGEGEGESGTSFNELSTSSSESHSEASSPQGTVIRGPVSRQTHVQTLDRPPKKGPVQHLLQQQQSEQCRKSDLLRTLTVSSRDTSTCKKRPAKEKLTVEEELEKCIKDFRKIKIPEHFPERKYMWQADLLRKYRL
uniref:Potassium channel tetramerization domain containing 16b n=1 Tax=Sinocyclocheilus grahami TaxID=75366 RepID=A0A672JVG5_SINGR